MRLLQVASYYAITILLILAEDNNVEVSMNEAHDNCSMPSFVSQLPLQYRREFRKIWFSGPRTSPGCERQRKQTEELILNLPDELRMKVREIMITTTESPRSTSFLRGLSPEHIHEFTSIMSDRSLSIPSRSRALREWAVDLLDPEAAERLERYVSFLEQKMDSYKEKLRRLSPQAISVHNRLQALKEERKAMINNMSASVKVELINLWREKCNSKASDDGDDLDPDLEAIACTSATTTSTPPITKNSRKQTSTTTSTTKAPSTTTIRRWRPWSSGVPQLETDGWQLLQDPQGLSRLLLTLFSGDKNIEMP